MMVWCIEAASALLWTSLSSAEGFPYLSATQQTISCSGNKHAAPNHAKLILPHWTSTKAVLLALEHNGLVLCTCPGKLRVSLNTCTGRHINMTHTQVCTWRHMCMTLAGLHMEAHVHDSCSLALSCAADLRLYRMVSLNSTVS